MTRLLNFPLKSGSHINIPQEIGTKYFQFGIQLLNDETGEEIEAIASKYREDAQEINFKILRLWMRGKGKPLDWDNLIQVLEAIGLSTLASDIQDGLPRSNCKSVFVVSETCILPTHKGSSQT